MTDPRELVQKNLEDVRRRMAAACLRRGRPQDSVTLVAVTKTVDAAAARALYDLGVRDFGENRIQQAEEKIAALSGLDIRWHMIGHLQRNKARDVVQRFAMIHSVDSLRIAEAIAEQARKRQTVARVLIQVNVSGEETKSGIASEEAGGMARDVARLDGLRLEGLMTMAPFCEDPEDCRPCFRRLRELRDEIAAAGIEGAEMKHLSMGMTNDFEVAIEEGADLIRVGSALFHGIIPPTPH